MTNDDEQDTQKSRNNFWTMSSVISWEASRAAVELLQAKGTALLVYHRFALSQCRCLQDYPDLDKVFHGIDT